MRLDDLRPTENVDDRRGSGFGGAGPRLAIGGGGLGLVAVVVLSLVFGVDPIQLLDTMNGADPINKRPRAIPAARAPTTRRINSPGGSWVRPKMCGRRSCGRKA